MQIVSVKRARPLSVTQQHLLTAIVTLLSEGEVQPRDGRLRILDIGCGDGQLIDHLHSGLSAAFPTIEIEIHGFDIGEQGYNDGSQLEVATLSLTKRYPWIDWRARLSLFSDSEPWQYPTDFFDIAISNQVIEHVKELPFFLAELRRCLSAEGASVHLFPLSNCIVEAHCQTPFAHWIHDFDRRSSWIALLSRLGIGAYRRHRKVLGHQSVREHAVETSKYIQCWTRYRDFAAISEACATADLAASNGLTKGLFVAKLRMLLRLAPLVRYRRSPIAGLDWLYFAIGRFLSSSTLVIKPMSYDIGRRIAAEKAASALREAA